eukprot:2564293-Rhodomonas_salina.1
MQFDLGASTAVAGVATKGRVEFEQWVRTFKVLHSLDGITWTDVNDGYAFPGNTDRNTQVSTLFAGSVEARYVRIYPQQWSGWMSMRAGVILQACCANWFQRDICPMVAAWLGDRKEH